MQSIASTPQEITIPSELYSHSYNQKYNFLFCPIPKVACTSLKTVVISCSDNPHKQEVLDAKKFHQAFRQTFGLKNLPSEKILEILNDPNVFKFTFVRNPWSRIFSAYLNKFVDQKSRNQVKIIQKALGTKVDIKKSISFKDFINYLTIATDDSELNHHWKPQYRFVEGIPLDFVGKMENLNQDYNYVKNLLQLNVDLPHYNKTKYADNSETFQDISYADLYPAEIKELSSYPQKNLFYTPELIEKVKQRYAKDIELFDYDFD